LTLALPRAQEKQSPFILSTGRHRFTRLNVSWIYPLLNRREVRINMAIRSGSSRRWIFPVALAIFLSAALTSISVAQERKNPQTAGVDNNKMGPYRALAQVAYAASQKGEYATAAALAKVLERTWDKGEDYGGDIALSKTNHALFEDIDKAMDQFVTLLMDHPTSAADPAREDCLQRLSGETEASGLALSNSVRLDACNARSSGGLSRF
jgi:hypothetical protein